MSVHDVAAIDRLQSRGVIKNDYKMTENSKKRSPHITSLPTSPVSDSRTDADTLRRAMARHQASLSRPESPNHILNDDIPTHKHSSYTRHTPLSSPALDRRSTASLRSSREGYREGLPERAGTSRLTPARSPFLDRKASSNFSTSHLTRDGYRTVASTGTTSSPKIRNKEPSGFEATKSSLRNSQVYLNELDFSSTGKGDSSLSSGSLMTGDESPDAVPKLSNARYPYLSNSTYSLPRNHRLYKSNRQFAASLRESQESLFSPSRESVFPESRESLLKRYSTSSHHGSPEQMRPAQNKYDSTDILYKSYSKNSSPHSTKSYTPDDTTKFGSTAYDLNKKNFTSLDTKFDEQHNLRNIKSRSYTPKHVPNDHIYGGPVLPSSPAHSLRSSRASSPSDSWYSGKDYGWKSDPVYSRHSSRATSPSTSQRSSRATSPAFSVKSERSSTRSLVNSLSRRRRPDFHNSYSQSSSVISSRATSPCSSISRNPSSTLLKSELGQLLSLEQLKSTPVAEVVYVKETFKVVPTLTNNTSEPTRLDVGIVRQDEIECNLERVDSEEASFVITKDSNAYSCQTENIPVQENTEKMSPQSENISSESNVVTKLESENNQDDVTLAEGSINQTDENKVNRQRLQSISTNLSGHDDFEDNTSVITTGSSNKVDRATSIDLSNEDFSNIEEMLQSLSRRVRNVEENERIREDVVDKDDSARAESVASFASSTNLEKRNEGERSDDETHSLIRRQSVIIEGLTLETEELRKKCQVLEDELTTPVVEDLNKKLQQAQSKLEETETYCYQVIEENVELKSEIEALESEISEVQDSFRDKDAKEFKKVKWELENLSKTCRNLQIKLGKAQAKASRLRQEKEEMEEEQKDQNLWKTSAVVAVAALAAYQLLSRWT